jgi:hypothetical protein
LPITANGSGNCPITFQELIPGESDYLVPEEDADGVQTGELVHVADWDSTYSVMRTVNLKADTFDTPGAIYAKTYTKWSYTTSVKLQDVSMLDTIDGQIAAVKLSTLTIYGLDEATLYPVNWNITVNGVAMDVELAAFAVALQVGGTMTVDITLPQFAYGAGDMVVIQVQYRAYMAWSAIEGFAEVGFPGFIDYVAPVPVE